MAVPATIKTTKSAFDIQVTAAEKALKAAKGINFVMRRGNTIDYVNIPNNPQQTFKYFVNTSHMTNADRQAIYRRRNEVKLLTHSSIIIPKIVEDEITNELLP